MYRDYRVDTLLCNGDHQNTHSVLRYGKNKINAKYKIFQLHAK